MVGHPRPNYISPYVIPPMSSEETCSQGFLNDDIFELIVFAVANESHRLALSAHNHCGNKVTVGIQRSEIWNIPQLRLRRNITFCASKKYHSSKARISLAIGKYHFISKNKRHSLLQVPFGLFF